MSGLKMEAAIRSGATWISGRPDGDGGDISLSISDCEAARTAFGCQLR
jgi:hypothetical protein